MKQIIPDSQLASDITSEGHYVCRTQIKGVVLPVDIIKKMNSTTRITFVDDIIAHRDAFLKKTSTSHQHGTFPITECIVRRSPERPILNDHLLTESSVVFAEVQWQQCVTSSCANFVQKHHADVGRGRFSEDTIQFIRRNFYNDDGLASVTFQRQAIQLVKEARELCSTGKLWLRKFISNSEEVIDTIP